MGKCLKLELTPKTTELLASRAPGVVKWIRISLGYMGGWHHVCLTSPRLLVSCVPFAFEVQPALGVHRLTVPQNAVIGEAIAMVNTYRRLNLSRCTRIYCTPTKLWLLDCH